MFLSEINIYPVKSLAGISLNSAVVEERGLQFDRRWMLVDEKNQFLTQREHPQMARFLTEIESVNLQINFDGEELKIPFLVSTEKAASVKVWSSSVKARILGDEINQWFSERLQKNVRLVLMPEESKRKINQFYAVRKFKDIVSFADAYPFLLIGENSLADLNERMEKKVPMNRFRPNLVVSGSEAFAEDRWKKIKIGETVFHVVKPCARCVMTTIDQEKGETNGKEPLKTLASYRNKNGKVLFGQNLIAENWGENVRVGDKVEILEVK